MKEVVYKIHTQAGKEPERNYEREFGLQADQFVVLPEHDAVPAGIDGRLISTFGSLATDLAGVFQDRREYPNAKLHLYPSTVSCSKTHIDFMLAWGNKTDLPHPRLDKVPEYFTRFQLMSAKRRGSVLTREVLDAEGIAGRLYLPDDHPMVKLYSNHDQPHKISVNTYHYDPSDFTTTTEIISDIQNLNPLKFHAGIRYVRFTQHIRNESFEGDQSRILGHIPLSVG